MLQLLFTLVRDERKKSEEDIQAKVDQPASVEHALAGVIPKASWTLLSQMILS